MDLMYWLAFGGGLLDAAFLKDLLSKMQDFRGAGGSGNAPKRTPKKGSKIGPHTITNECEFETFLALLFLFWFLLALLGLSWLNLGLS